MREVDDTETAPNPVCHCPRAIYLLIPTVYNPCDQAREKNEPGCCRKKPKWSINGVAESVQHVRWKMIRRHKHETQPTECIDQEIAFHLLLAGSHRHHAVLSR